MVQSGVLVPCSKADFPAELKAYSSSAAHTDTWNPGVRAVLVWSTTDAYIEVGEGAEATADSTPIPANTPTVFAVPKGTGAAWRVSAIRISQDGTVYAKPVQIQAF